MNRVDEEAIPLIERWRIYPSKNKFYCNARLVTGNALCFLLISIFLFFLGTGCVIYDSLSYPFIWEFVILSTSLLLLILNLTTLLLASCSDPGIVPRSSVDEVRSLLEENHLYYNRNDRRLVGEIPELMKRTRNGIQYRAKFCDTCLIFRRFRTSHCRLCNNCVEKFDHHCPWINNCVGQRNLKSFYFLLLFICCKCVFTFIVSITTIAKRFIAMTRKEKGSSTQWFSLSIPSIVAIIISDVTVNEKIKVKRNADEVAWMQERDVGGCQNYKRILCTQQTKRSVNWRKFIPANYYRRHFATLITEFGKPQSAHSQLPIRPALR
ncbi:hypothetical protein SNEBB_009089 [Seison nebaliae]|nr:hypothetical protein SNEBB_009089 [Seison nebaliae]